MASSRALKLTIAKNICSVNEMWWEAESLTGIICL